MQKYIGEGSRMVRELFVMAREHAPSIIFMDEIDSIGSQRTEGEHGDSEVQRTMMELLNQLDGFESTQNIKVSRASRTGLHRARDKSTDPGEGGRARLRARGGGLYVGAAGEGGASGREDSDEREQKEGGRGEGLMMMLREGGRREEEEVQVTKRLCVFSDLR